MQGAYSSWIIRPFVPLSVNLSVISYKGRYFEFGWSYSNKPWTVSSSKGCSHFTDIICPWETSGAGWGQNVGLTDFDFVAAEGIRVSQMHLVQT